MKKEVGDIVELLVQEKYISEQAAQDAGKHAKEQGMPTLSYLYDNDLVSKEIVGQAIAEQYSVQYFDLANHMPDKATVLKVNQDVAEKFRVVLVKTDRETLYFATDQPTSEIKDQLSSLYPKAKIGLYYSFLEDINQALSSYETSISSRFDEIIKNSSKIGPRIVEEIVKEAVGLKSSDIHFEPQRDKVLIRLRVDGVLRESGSTEKQYYDVVVNRIKVLCQLRIDEHFGVQDGSMQVVVDEKPIDLRVSIVPTVNGEKIVIRILAKYISTDSLSDLGLSEDHKKQLSDAIAKPHGMIVVTGPTGSGKTTTLYTLLHMLNIPSRNITTIEDPVEYHLERVNQIQVNPSTDLTFAKGLKSIVRQDPDIILVGEIRDEETANISINAALTGHLLLTTLHANDASTAIPRLLDLGVEPFLASSTLELLIAQRLVRKICMVCRYSLEYKPDSKTNGPVIEELIGQNIYSAKGCNVCGNSGYKGRVALFEIIEVNLAMRNLMLTNPSTEQIWQLAKKQGAVSLYEDGIDKIKQGLTTPDEVARVAKKH